MNGDDGITIYRNEIDLNNNDQSVKEEKHGLSGGAIGGIITSIVAVCALGIGFFVWKRRNQRQRNIHQTSRAARFSQSPTPMYDIKQHDCEKLEIDDNFKNKFKGDVHKTKLENANFLSLPELALSPCSKKNRISTVSLGAEFRFSADDYRRQSHLSRDSVILGDSDSIQNKKIAPRNSSNSTFSRHQLESLSEEENKVAPMADNKRRESTGFRRLTLNLFSGSSQQNNQNFDKKKDRSSSLFQLRASRLLQPDTPATPDGQYPLTAKGNMSRASLGAKSVSSIQWVGFNDSMDYKGNNWRDSSTSSMHLAVKNTRASSYYTSDSAQSTPRSPMFPSHLRDPMPQYHANEMDNSSMSHNRN
jgi:hypothetical protein